jgi:hypothetical protein
MVPVFLPVCAAAAAYPQVRFPNPEAACSILDNKINFLQVKRQIVAQRKFLQGHDIAERANLPPGSAKGADHEA